MGKKKHAHLGPKAREAFAVLRAAENASRLLLKPTSIRHIGGGGNAGKKIRACFTTQIVAETSGLTHKLMCAELLRPCVSAVLVALRNFSRLKKI